MQFLVEFKANTAIRVICALWFAAMVLIGGAGRLFGEIGGAAWDFLVPPERVGAILHPRPAPVPPPVVIISTTRGESDAEMRARQAGWGAGQELSGANATGGGY